MDRFVNEELFDYILYNLCEEEVETKGEIVNDVFELRVFSYDEDDPEANTFFKPNFYHKPSGFKMCWYKHPLRGIETNMELSHEDFASVLYDCRQYYLNARSDGFTVNYDIGNTRWWEQ